jgi:ABC-2 type transport system ATP-binding protein
VNPATVRLVGSFSISLAASAAALAFVAVDPPLTRMQSVPSLLTAGGVSCLLFVLLAGRVPWPPPPRTWRIRAIGVRGAYLTFTSAAEEVVWRWLVLGASAPVVGLAPAFVASTIGFALAHGIRRRDVAVVHLVTGTAFGAVYVATGRPEAAILAHALYNWLVLVALESETGATPLPATISGDPAAILEGVRKRYREVEALRNFSLAVARGEVVALLGPNGAGKTTALSILLGLRSPDEGTARLFGRAPRDVSARRYVGATPQETGFPPTLRVKEIVDLVRAHYPRPRKTAEVLSQFGLGDVAGRQAGGLSGGQKRRLAVTLAFVGNPKAIFLDEPTAGLDVEARRRVWDDVRAYAEDGGTILLTTHNLEEADALASRVVVIVGGTTLATGTPGEVKARAGLRRVRLESGALPELPGVERASRAGRMHTLFTAEPESIVRHLVEHGVPLRGLEVTPVSLEEAFLSLTERAE